MDHANHLTVNWLFGVLCYAVESILRVLFGPYLGPRPTGI